MRNLFDESALNTLDSRMSLQLHSSVSSSLAVICYWFSVCLLLLLSCSSTLETAEKCETCRELVKRFNEGLKKTAKGSFGGGNTKWEESRLGSFSTSETRFVEVVEHACEENSKECHHMLEEHEELLERWFFKHYANGVHLDLEAFFCIDRLRICCPVGKYGKDCEDCPGGTERPCSGNGECEGSGTRDGSGKCECKFGYQGTLCTECIDEFFVEVQNETHIICQPCHPGCLGSCSGPDSTDCGNCREGYEHSEEKGCLDINECESGEHTCDYHQYCANKQGTYRCQQCDAACDGCTGYGPAQCLACSDRHYNDDGVCTPCHVACASWCRDGTASTCDACNEGWQPDGFGLLSQACKDVDECAEGLRTCDQQSFCRNTEGSSTCVACHQSCSGCTGPLASDCITCRSGYAFDVNTNECTDVDECAGVNSGALCSRETEKCVNTVGSYRCDCADGFKRRSGKCEAKKKPSQTKTKDKLKTSSGDAAGPDFDSSPLTAGLGKPLQGRPVDEEMIVIEGNLNIPPTQDVETGDTDGSNTKRVDL